MLNNSYEAECINTTSQEMFWRRPNGSVVSVNSYLKVNNSKDIFMCEVPFMGSEPAYVYKETVAFSQDGDSSDTDQPGTQHYKVIRTFSAGVYLCKVSIAWRLMSIVQYEMSDITCNYICMWYGLMHSFIFHRARLQ